MDWCTLQRLITQAKAQVNPKTNLVCKFRNKKSDEWILVSTDVLRNRNHKKTLLVMHTYLFLSQKWYV